ncbi:MAG: amino acid ABC transporter ATP-binding protein [Tissierellia bacterium]|nr:amino acid ABC transporter ATP-binding protein [Tissierellia bacterium]
MVLKVDWLNKSFGKKRILKDISFELNTGEILTIIGPSGAGKTTLLRCINGLEKSDRGTIFIDNAYLCRDYNDKNIYARSREMKEIRQKIGMVFQNYNLFPHMTVMENIIEAPIHVLGLSRDEAVNRAYELLESLGLEDKTDSYPFQLSGGQKQRVAIARALCLNPKILCLDEPTSALDPELRGGIASIIENLASKGMAILIITHDMDFAKRVATRVIFMEDGRIIKEGEKEEFFNSFKDDRIRKFMVL